VLVAEAQQQPHVRRVVVRVPEVPTPHARLLLRIGDEHRERGVLLPQRFTVALPPSLAIVPSTSTPDLASSAGEPALAHEAGVVAWVEGSRRGDGWHLVAVQQPPRLDSACRSRAPLASEAAEISESSPRIAAPLATADFATPRRSSFARSPAPSTSLPAPTDILLLGRRRNV